MGALIGFIAGAAFGVWAACDLNGGILGMIGLGFMFGMSGLVIGDIVDDPPGR